MDPTGSQLQTKFKLKRTRSRKPESNGRAVLQPWRSILREIAWKGQKSLMPATILMAEKDRVQEGKKTVKGGRKQEEDPQGHWK